MLRLLLYTAIFSLLSCSSIHYKVTTFTKNFDKLGETTYVIAHSKEQSESLEYENYSKMLIYELANKGWHLAKDEKSAHYKIIISYGMDDGKTTIYSAPIFNQYGYAGSIKDSDIIYKAFLKLDIFNKASIKVYETTIIGESNINNFFEISGCLFEGLFKTFPSNNGVQLKGKIRDCKIKR